MNRPRNRLILKDFIVGSDTTEFVNKVREPSANSTEKKCRTNAESLCRTFDIVGNVYGYDIECSDIYGKELLNDAEVLCKNLEENITLKQMFDITAQTIHNDDEIQLLGQSSVGRAILGQRLSLIDDETVIIGLQSTKVYVFSDSVLCLGKVLQHPECNEAWKKQSCRSTSREEATEIMMLVNGESTDFEWNIFPRFTSLQLCDKISDLLSSTWDHHQKLSQEEFYLCQCSMTSPVKRKDNKEECLKYARHL